MPRKKKASAAEGEVLIASEESSISTPAILLQSLCQTLAITPSGQQITQDWGCTMTHKFIIYPYSDVKAHITYC